MDKNWVHHVDYYIDGRIGIDRREKKVRGNTWRGPYDL